MNHYPITQMTINLTDEEETYYREIWNQYKRKLKGYDRITFPEFVIRHSLAIAYVMRIKEK